MMVRTLSSRSRRATPLVASALAALLTFGVLTTAPAAIPDEINYQAYLTDTTGLPIVSPTVTLTLEFFDAAAAGTSLGSYTTPVPLNLADSRGFVNIAVPTVSLSAGDLNNPLFVEVTIDDGVNLETLPGRQAILPAPTALNTKFLEGLSSSQFVDTVNAQSVGGIKTFTDNMIVSLPALSTIVSGESGAGISVLATQDPAAVRGIGIRGRVLANTVEAGPRQVQGVMGSGQSAGGSLTSVSGGYFQARVLDNATDGIAVATAVSADVDVLAGAAGFAADQFLLGGRFGVNATNSGDASAIGVLTIVDGAHSGSSTGVAGVGRASTSANVGVLGAANASDLDLGILGTTVNAPGIGVLAYNTDAAGLALRADGPSRFNGNVTVAGMVTLDPAINPVNPGDLTTKQYVDAVASGGGGFVDLTTDQSVGGIKTFTDNMIVSLPALSTIVSGESGAGISVLATQDPAAVRGTGIRGRVQATTVEAAPRIVQGVMGSGQTAGGSSTQVDGGYFQARVLANATDGIGAATAVSADVDVQAGAAGFAADQFLLGGRFGVNATNSGDASAIGSLAIVDGAHSGSSTGVAGVGRASTSANVGVLGAANASDLDLAILGTTVNADGVGVLAYNSNALGVALRAQGPSQLLGDVTIQGLATLNPVVDPVAAGDLVPKQYIDNSFATLTRTLVVVPTGGATTPDGSLAAPYGSIADAYAQATTLSPNFFNRVLILLMPGEHVVTSTITMNTVGIDIVGFGDRTVTIRGTDTADPIIDMTATTSGAVVRNVNISAHTGGTNVAIRSEGGRLERVALRRSTAPGTLLEVDVPSGQTFSCSQFEIYGDVSVLNYGDQSTFSLGFVTGTVNATGVTSAAEFLAFNNVSAIGSLSFLPAPGLLLLGNVGTINAINYNAFTVLRASSTNFVSTLGVPLALPDPAAGSAVVNCVGGVTAWTGSLASSGGNVVGEYTAYERK